MDEGRSNLRLFNQGSAEQFAAETPPTARGAYRPYQEHGFSHLQVQVQKYSQSTDPGRENEDLRPNRRSWCSASSKKIRNNILLGELYIIITFCFNSLLLYHPNYYGCYFQSFFFLLVGRGICQLFK